MFEKENKANRKKTGFIYCQSFPFPRLVSTHGATGSAPTASMSPSQEARAHQRDALNWVEAAHEAIGTVLFLKLTGKESNIKKLKTMQEQIALNTHFKLNKHPNPFSFLNELARTYNQIRVALARADSLFVDDLTNKVAFAYAYPGGMYSQIFDHKKIYFCSSYLGKGPLLQTAVIVHEIAHYVDRDILHFASELPPPKGSPVDSSKNYIQLTPHEAARNAYTYAQFALHTFLKRDKRIVPFNE
jgi:hypothetical protein